MSTLRGPAQLADLQGALCVLTFDFTYDLLYRRMSHIVFTTPPGTFHLPTGQALATVPVVGVYRRAWYRSVL